MPSGLSCRLETGVWPLGAADGNRRALHLQAVFRIALAALDLFMRQLAGMDRVAARVFGAGEIVRHRLNLQNVEAAELGDLLEGKRGIVDQPGCRGMGHQRCGL